MRRVCDGTEECGTIMFLALDGTRALDPEFAVCALPCDCDSIFDDQVLSIEFPHYRLVTPESERLISDLPDVFGWF